MLFFLSFVLQYAVRAREPDGQAHTDRAED